MEVIMNKFTFIRCLIWNATFIVFFSSQTGYCQTDIPAGDVSGTWSLANSPYHINGNITIPDEQTLTIEPGVTVIFKEACKLDVQGCLMAVGTREDTITFTAEDPSAGWHAIKFRNTPAINDTSKIVFCKIEYGKLDQGGDLDRCGGAVFALYVSKLIISNCLLQNNRVYNTGNMYSGSGGAISLDHASPIISNNRIINNTSYNHVAGGIICYYSDPIISNNVIVKNTADYGGGIFFFGSNPIVTNNIIVKNEAGQYGGGLRCYEGANPVLINNTIALNTAQLTGGGVSCINNSDPLFINTILYGNTAGSGDQVHLVSPDSDPGFYYCNIEGGMESFEGDGAGSEYSGAYENNLNADPCFIDMESDDFCLSESSLCVGAGIDSVEINGLWYYCPDNCFCGNPRPDPPGTNPDIGACESAYPVGIESIVSPYLPNTYRLAQNYPNPFNPSTTIEFDLPRTSNVTLKIFNILGEEVATLISERLPTGKYDYQWEASQQASGIYFYQLETGDYHRTRKMILTK
jgi:hypothetical protein